MALYANVRNGVVVELVDTLTFDIKEVFHPDIIKDNTFIKCDSTVGLNFTYTNGVFSPPTEVSVEEKAKQELLFETASLKDITIKQLTLAMHDEGLITDQEIENWLTKTGLPAFVTSLLDKLPTDKKLSAKVTFLTMTVAQRTDPLITFIIENSKDLLGKEITDADVNDFWKKALAIT